MPTLLQHRQPARRRRRQTGRAPASPVRCHRPPSHHPCSCCCPSLRRSHHHQPPNCHRRCHQHQRRCHLRHRRCHLRWLRCRLRHSFPPRRGYRKQRPHPLSPRPRRQTLRCCCTDRQRRTDRCRPGPGRQRQGAGRPARARGRRGPRLGRGGGARICGAVSGADFEEFELELWQCFEAAAAATGRSRAPAAYAHPPDGGRLPL